MGLQAFKQTKLAECPKEPVTFDSGFKSPQVPASCGALQMPNGRLMTDIFDTVINFYEK